jgi:hypothetical protein
VESEIPALSRKSSDALNGRDVVLESWAIFRMPSFREVYLRQKKTWGGVEGGHQRGVCTHTVREEWEKEHR